MSDACDRPLKIVGIIARLNVGGPARHVIVLDSGLRRRGHITRLAHGEVNADEASMAPLAIEQHVHAIEVPHLGRSLRPFRDVQAFVRLVALLFAVRPDVVHTHTSKAGLVGRTAALVFNATRSRSRRCAVIHTFHGHVFDGYFSRPISGLVRRMEQLLALATDRIITISALQRADIVTHFAIAGGAKVATIPIGLDLDPLLHVSGSTPDLRRELGIEPDAIVVGYVGRLAPIKDPETLVQAFALAMARVPDLVLLVAGDGQLRTSLERLSDRLNIRPRVRFLGWTNQLIEVYATMDICALSSINEGTPVALIEAMAARKTVVATSVGGVPDIIADGTNGLLVPPRTPEKLADALVRLATDAALRNQMGMAGRRFAAAHHSGAESVAAVEDLYRLVLAERRGV